MFPEAWVSQQIEKVAGCRAYPVFVPKTAAVPFVQFSRRSTTRENSLVDSGGFPAAEFTVNVYADGYLEVKTLAYKIRRGLEYFAGDSAGVTIGSVSLMDEADGEPEFFSGEDTPTYLVSLVFLVRFTEEI
jgi:hypothetical protein